ncbi:glyoxylate utilization-related uncharacterized protein [Deinococcus metalli]|uniref:Glyoxylate utilization-related uncharacterized protein n=1 Tax=Deinococcus metalli TaxID=1141878 RepID=A0A7W8KEE6_9DEIO|nr:hypothetical protein [Deinococcus metalli]MBB5376213.1 glyoxylate utilization-related uncharacterized protein [Deinococcus metalli]GHF39933.1 hypothetical protein GCM10017781_15690 [Deinococcus metalli]
MTTGAAGRVLVWSVVLGLGVAAASGPVRLDPGEGARPVSTVADTTPWTVTLRIEPGAQAPLRPMMGEYRVSVQSGELTMVMNGVSETVGSGQTRVIAPGTDFRLLNRGDAPAEVQVTLSFAGLDFPQTYPGRGLA